MGAVRPGLGLTLASRVKDTCALPLILSIANMPGTSPLAAIDWTAILSRILGTHKLRTSFASVLAELESRLYILHAPSGDAILDALLERSCRHPNGFYKLVLSHSGFDSPELRLHVWPPDAPNLRSQDIHNHPWDFCSKVLAGGIRIDYYRTALAGIPHLEYESPVAPRGSPHVFVDRGIKNLAHKEVVTLAHGDAYFCPYNQLHSVTPNEGQCTVTLFVRMPYRRLKTKIFRPLTSGDKRNEATSRIDMDELRRVLTLAKSAFDAN
jgi:hypothetical protein